MELTKIDVTRNRVLARQVRALYEEAFPKSERLPWWILVGNARRRGIDLEGWVENGQLVAMTSSVTTPKLHFLLFFAIAPHLRGKGYGSQILQQLQRTHKTLILNVEPLEADAPNLAQRQRRFAFYQRNGLQDTGWFVWEVGGMFRVLSTAPQLDVAAYRQVFRKLTFGIWKVRLEKERKS